MADRFRLRVYTPERELVDADVREVTAEGALGQIGVLPDHAALVTALEPGELAYRADAGMARLRLGGGFAEVRDNVLTVLADSGEPATQVGVRHRTMGKLDGKTALVTGGGRGIGRGIVVEFAREGADVAINYRRDREAAEATAAEVRALGRRTVVLQADVGEREGVEAMVAQAVEFLGGLDVAVANSGVAARVATVAKTDPAEWRRGR